MADTDLIERLDRDIQMAERARSEMIEQGHPGWPNAVLFLMETATEVRTQLIASRAECEGLRAANEEYYARGFGLRRRIVDYLNSQASKNAIRNAFTEWECASGTKFLLPPAEIARAALSQKETGNAA